ncbi:uncharacterized protein LOC131167277 [Malania oleifera]|uniref:uncharacterized protein LOC131167277 n=1 Tax=Malania oleifera TaxID=397392 RepID=UPI0025AE64C1|nr:uncharacterized protein LOC131167277 [Malania oleifera]
MAVPGRGNGLMDEDDVAENNAFFEEEGLIEAESDAPPHLRALADAAQLGNVDAFRLALDSLNDIDEPVEDGDTALHLACLYGKLPCVQLLLERGACLEAKDEDGAIPLHDACAGGYIDIVRLLLSSANTTESIKRMLETGDVEGDTPLHHAARGEHADVIRLLLASGASPSMRNNYGQTPSELSDAETEARRILEAASSVVMSN